ncbi:helix-turn-helix domain-containing protein [Enterocloster lavalensis]|uniref:helix-turn-helix domain-containing protein n=1 Tax=Enterocloster lavalensis TaxID=460384 RepID=UPI00266513AE|nr:helix-turn-helix domain-containing protein [Enterocloster lavalensis]
MTTRKKPARKTAKKPGRQKWQEWEGDEDRLNVLAAWARAGKTDEEISKAIGISRSTLAEWKKKYEGIRTALSIGREYADRLVENSLYKIALGYTVTEKKAFKLRRIEYDELGKKKSEEEVLEYADETRHISGDLRAIAFWLKNHKPEFWSDKGIQPGDEDKGVAGTIVFDTASVAEIKKVMEEEEQKNAEKEK